MKDRRVFRPLTLILDAATGLAFFLLLAGVLTRGCDGNSIHLGDLMPAAHAAYIPGVSTGDIIQQRSATLPLTMINTSPGQLYRGTTRTTAFLVLGAVFTLLFVANLALYRHLRANYTRPRRRRITS